MDDSVCSIGRSDSLKRLNSLDVSPKPGIARGFGSSRDIEGTLSTRSHHCPEKRHQSMRQSMESSVSDDGQYCLSVLQDPILRPLKNVHGRLKHYPKPITHMQQRLCNQIL